MRTQPKRNFIARITVSLLFVLIAFTPHIWSGLAAQARPLSISDQINAASPSSVITLEARTYSEDLIITHSGTSSSPITLRGAGIDQTIIHGRIVLTNSASSIVIEGLSIDASDSGEDGIRLTANNAHITLRNLHLYDGKSSGHYGIRVGDGSSDILIEDCHVHHFTGGGTDSHGIGIMAARNVTVRRCKIHDNQGDGVQSNTQDAGLSSPRASNILIEANEIYSNTENAIDIKSTLGVQVIGNTIYHYRPSGSSDGTAIQVQYGARDVVVSANTVWDAVQGLEVTRGRKNGSDYPEAPDQIKLHHNYFHDTVLDSAASTGSGNGITLRAGSNIQVYNNTFARIANTGLYLGKASSEKASNVDVRNNVLQGAANDADFSDPASSTPNLIFDYNHYSTGKVDGKTLAHWLGQSVEKHASSGDPALDANGAPSAGSPLTDSGVNVGLPFSDSAPDRGWAEAEATPAPTATPGPSPTPMPARQFLPLLY